MKTPSIKDIVAMDDQGMRDLLKQDEELTAFRSAVEELDKLKGKARTEAESRLQDRLQPNIDARELKWIKEDALHAGKMELNDTAVKAL